MIVYSWNKGDLRSTSSLGQETGENNKVQHEIDALYPQVEENLITF